MNTTLRFVLGFAFAIAATGALLAHEGATGIVKERMEGMETLGRVAKTITRRIESNRNLAAIKDDAAKLTEIATRIPVLFPTGTNDKPSDAKSEIWQQWDVFVDRARRLELATGQLGQIAASGDPRAIARQFAVVADACTACHDTFRAKR
jgi:cytochrome c556